MAQTPILNLGLGAIHPAIPNNAHRVRRCLLFLAEHPDSSNREIATGIGITDQSQMSRLLASLARENLATKHSEGIGKRNAWQLTTHGEEIAGMLSAK